MNERIIGAAIRICGRVWDVPQPGRHCDVIRYYCKRTGERCIPPQAEAESVQGFVTSEGRFVSRVEAARIAFDADQIATPKDYLFSEDVW